MGARVIYTHLAAAILAGALGFAGAWNVQGWRLGEQIAALKTAQDKALITAIEGARVQEQARYKGVSDAQVNATKRATVARNDAAAARGELERLRDATNSTRSGVPGESATACTQRADTAGKLLDSCGQALVGLGEQADRLNSDRLMLLEGWPR